MHVIAISIKYIAKLIEISDYFMIPASSIPVRNHSAYMGGVGTVNVIDYLTLFRTLVIIIVDVM